MKREFIEVGAGPFILALRPIAHLRVGGIFQPLIIVNDLDTMIAIGDGL